MALQFEHVRWEMTLLPRFTLGRVGAGGFWMGHGFYIIWNDPNNLQ